MRRVGALAVASSAQALEPSILDTGAAERRRQWLLVELGPSARTRIRTDVGKGRNSMLAEQFEEALDRMRRMADRVERRPRRRGRGFFSVRHPPAFDRERAALKRPLRGEPREESAERGQRE